MELTSEEGRVLGALVEKELTTPQAYPLTDNALVAACNQTTSREPVVSYDVPTVRVAVRSLREQGLLRTVHRTGERSDKHRHELPAALGLSAEQVAVLAVLLLRGTEESARATTVLVAIKMVVLALFIGFGAFYVSSANYEPFIPANEGTFGEFGVSGVLRAAAAVFYAYIGFDILCNAAQEARDPRRTIPRGILATLAISTLLYVAVALVVTGLADYTMLDVSDPLSVALNNVSELEWLQSVIDVGTVLFLAATVLATMYGLTRILMRVSEDGMLPALVARVNQARGTPTATTLIVAGVTAAIAALLPISTLADLVSAGTLTAFVFVGISVLVLRRNRPDLERSFRLPLGPTIPLATIVVTIAVVLMLPGLTLIRLVIWVAAGLLLYGLYARGRAEAVISERIGEAKG